MLTYYEARRLASPRRGRRQSEIYIASVQGRRLRVYIEVDSDPLFVTTVAWEDR